MANFGWNSLSGFFGFVCAITTTMISVQNRKRFFNPGKLASKASNMVGYSQWPVCYFRSLSELWQS